MCTLATLQVGVGYGMHVCTRQASALETIFCRYLTSSWIGPVLLQEKEFQANERDSWNQAAPSTTPMPVVERMEEKEICNARLAPDTPWNTPASAPPVPQDRPGN